MRDNSYWLLRVLSCHFFMMHLGLLCFILTVEVKSSLVLFGLSINTATFVSFLVVQLLFFPFAVVRGWSSKHWKRRPPMSLQSALTTGLNWKRITWTGKKHGFLLNGVSILHSLSSLTFLKFIDRYYGWFPRRF